MKRFFEQELRTLRSHLVELGQKSIEQVELAVRALMEGDKELAAWVRAHDDDLDRLEMEIDAEAIRYISLRAPVASELRMVIVGMRAAQDLERVGDEATNIAKRVRKIKMQIPRDSVREKLERMATTTIELLRTALDSLLEADGNKAHPIRDRDEEIDTLNKKIFNALSQRMIETPESVPISLHLIFVARSLERIGDHATNLAEEVIYLLNGKDIRHDRS